MSGSPPRSRRDALALALFVAVPLAVSPGVGDEFTTLKWLVLEGLAVAWFLAELWRAGGRGWPTFVREHGKVLLALGAVLVAGSLRSGPAWAAPALLDRLAFVLLALAAYWSFRRGGDTTGAAALGTAVAACFVASWGLAQALGWEPVPTLTAGDRRSASFGNVNMAAQYLGFAVLLLLAGRRPGPLFRPALRDAIVVASLAVLYFLSCRSAFVALAAGLAVLLATGRVAAASLARMLGAAAIVVVLVLRLAPDGLKHPFHSTVRDEKAFSADMRLAVWGSTLEMIADHPLGVGASNFGDAFIPYQLGIEIIRGERVQFRTPHNEILRVVAEEGLAFAALAFALLVALARRLSGGPSAGGWRSGTGPILGAAAAFLATEALFQFPLGTPFGFLMAAVLLGLALAALEPAEPESPPRAGDSGRTWRGLGTLAASAALVLLGRQVVSEALLASRPGDAAAVETACRLNPRHLPACVTAAWLRAAGGQSGEARRILHETLRRSPHYHPAIRLLGEVAASEGAWEEACLYLWIYDGLFRGRSAVRPTVVNRCRGVRPAGLPPDFAVPHYRRLPVLYWSGVEAPPGKDGGGSGTGGGNGPDAGPGK